jgi:hypothetical protein
VLVGVRARAVRPCHARGAARRARCQPVGCRVEGWPNPYPDGPSVPPTNGAITLDNLIHKGDIPVTIAIFIKPGTDPGYALHRSKEYDTISDTYAAFLEQEILCWWRLGTISRRIPR